jgi:hypothetical protein
VKGQRGRKKEKKQILDRQIRSKHAQTTSRYQLQKQQAIPFQTASRTKKKKKRHKKKIKTAPQKSQPLTSSPPTCFSSS